MDEPDNPYRKGSAIWSVMEGDWADLPPSEIAYVLGTTVSAVRSAMGRIKRETGYDVPRLDERKSRWGYE